MRAMSADTISLMSAPTKKPIARVVNTVERAVGRRDLVLARKGVRDSVVSLAGLLGCPVTNEDGREIGRLAEVVGAQAGGYAPGRVVSSPVGGVMNTAEDVKYIPGFAQPFINPPAGSKAGRAHRQNSISRTGVGSRGRSCR